MSSEPGTPALILCALDAATHVRTHVGIAWATLDSIGRRETMTRQNKGVMLRGMDILRLVWAAPGRTLSDHFRNS